MTYKEPPKWPVTNKLREEFLQTGGNFVNIDSNERTKWYALTALINRIDNGDVNLYLKTCNRIATRDDLKLFMRRIKLIDFPFRDQSEEPEIKIKVEAPKNEINEVSDEDLMSALKTLIKNSPMKILSTEKALELLAQRDILVAREKILDFVKAHDDVFKTFNSQNCEVLITFMHKK